MVVNTIAFAGMGQANFKSIRSSTDSLLPNYKVWQRYLSVAAQPASRYLSLLSYQFNFPYQVNIMSPFLSACGSLMATLPRNVPRGHGRALVLILPNPVNLFPNLDAFPVLY